MPSALQNQAPNSTLTFASPQRVSHIIFAYTTSGTTQPQVQHPRPTLPSPASLRSAAVAVLCALTLAACTTTAALQVVGAAVNAALETSGLKQPADGVRHVTIRLDAGDALNGSRDGEPLALVVRLYQLKADTGFSALGYDQFIDQGGERQLLGDDLVGVREMTLLPGRSYTVSEPIPPDVKVIGIVALFHSPAAARWRYAFDPEASAEAGISLGLHACAMTVGTGVLVNPMTTRTAARLAGVRCPS
ncbi:type VI secretion system lipoprotein TssJ [Nitrogeniibacter mangrovi]|uniref:Type VI secretion system lipoprotein TssJ n=1 Tax=Nitrogeniibacter mangrovi TaxID=2016596 RepID=A0A6C1B386_9RHOO|nr:type VI secretion system lipoprotein TssJ [Nitrogeniibacter mangrovi]QID17449.1 type VI secretion system lipoprotein TssJ [Nitrogeniibacter mangrovi]